MWHIRNHISDGLQAQDRVADGFLIEHLWKQRLIDGPTYRAWLKFSRGLPNRTYNPDGDVIVEHAGLETSRKYTNRSDTASNNSTGYDEPYSHESSEPFDRGSTIPTSVMERSSAQSKAYQIGSEFLGPAPDNHKETVLMNFRDDDDDIQSIASSVNSISSTESTDGSLGHAGIKYIVAKLTGDPELLALYTEAGQRLTEIRFVENNRRLLGRLYRDISKEVHTASQKQAAVFLRSRRRRNAISTNVFRAVLPDDCPDEEERSLLERQKTEYVMLDRYLHNLDAAGKLCAQHLHSKQHINKSKY